MSRAETAALIAPLEAAGLTVFQGTAPDESAFPYAIVRPSLTAVVQERLTGPYSTYTPTWTVLCAGSDQEQMEWLVEHVDAALRPHGVGIIPAVVGRVCGRVRRDALSPVQVDADVTPPAFIQVAEYSYRSAPA